MGTTAARCVDPHAKSSVGFARAPWLDNWHAAAEQYSQAAGGLTDCGEAGIRRELVFCLLGGHGVSFELALSATDLVMRLAPFDERWESRLLERRLREELAAPQFEPRCANGSPRRYRFPNRKARLICEARAWVDRIGRLSQAFGRLDCEYERRRLLCTCPGFGPKSASWLLRNTGFATDLAVLDVHVLRAMDELGELEGAMLPRDYELLEERFAQWCRALGTTAAALDLFLWEWQRDRLHRPPAASV